MTALVLTIIYASALCFLVNRLKQIRKYPKKFDTVPGYEEYRKSIWYWPTYREAPSGTPPKSCGNAGNVGFGLLACWYVLTAFLYVQVMTHFRSGEYSFVPLNVWIAYMIVTAAFVVFMSEYLVMFSKRPMAICHNLHVIFRKDARSTAWEKMTKLAVVAVIIMFPFRLAVLHNYGYADSEKLVYTPIFSIHEQVFEYDNIIRIEPILNDDGNKIEHCYIYNEVGNRFDLTASYSCLEDGYHEIAEYVVEHLPEEQRVELQEYLIKIDPERFG